MTPCIVSFKLVFDDLDFRGLNGAVGIVPETGRIAVIFRVYQGDVHAVDESHELVTVPPESHAAFRNAVPGGKIVAGAINGVLKRARVSVYPDNIVDGRCVVKAVVAQCAEDLGADPVEYHVRTGQDFVLAVYADHVVYALDG